MCGGNRRFPTARRAKRQRADHPAAADGFQRKPLSAKRKSTLPGAFSFGGGGESRTPVRKRFGAGVSECSLSFRIPLTQRRQTGYALRYPLIHHRTQGTVRWRSPLIDARSGAVVLSGRTAAFSYAASATLLSLAFNFKFGVMKESRLLLAAHASTSPSKPLRPHREQHQCCLSARSMVRWAAFFAASARLS